MKTPDFREEEGQSLIQVALMLVVLIGFVGLALDGGNLYAERRRMQNAADAGALAGAWAMCKVNDPAAAKAKAAEYMQKNGDLDAAVGNVDIVGYKVTTHASKPVTPFLPFTFGGSVNVPANASAACGAANSSCGLWPIAFRQSDWQNFETMGACALGTKIAIWTSDNVNDQPQNQCVIGTSTKNTVCDCYECKDSSNKPIILAFGNTRSWLDFSQQTNAVTEAPGSTGCGTNELRDNIEGNPTSLVKIGACVSGISGVRAAAESSVNERSGDNVNIVLYDDAPCTAPSCPGGTPRHIASFGCIKVSTPGWEKNFELKAKSGAKDVSTGKALKNAKMNVIWAQMNCNGECETSCGSTDGSPPDPNGVNAANLVP